MFKNLVGFFAGFIVMGFMVVIVIADGSKGIGPPREQDIRAMERGKEIAKITNVEEDTSIRIPHKLGSYKHETGMYPENLSLIKGINEYDAWGNKYVYIKNTPSYDKYPREKIGGSVSVPKNRAYYIYSLGKDGKTGSVEYCRDDINNWDREKSWRKVYGYRVSEKGHNIILE